MTPSALEFYGFVVLTFGALVFIASKCDQLRHRIERLEAETERSHVHLQTEAKT